MLECVYVCTHAPLGTPSEPLACLECISIAHSLGRTLVAVTAHLSECHPSSSIHSMQCSVARIPSFKLLKTISFDSWFGS